jgi:hypothetical protein
LSVSADEIEMGPIDYVLIEWPGPPTGEGATILADLVDRGIIRLLDIAFISKAEDGSVTAMELDALSKEVPELTVFEGASSGLLGEEDHNEAAEALEPGTNAALILFENRWAAPFVAAVRRAGGQMVATGRIPAQEVLDALDAVEAAT